MSGPMLEVKGLSSGYGDIRAIEDASLTVAAGEIVTVLGPNGAGKTTLLSAIAGLTSTFAGTVRLDGSPIDRLPPFRRTRAGIALVQENKRVFRGLSVRENLEVSGRTSRQRANSLLESSLDAFPDLRSRLGRPAGALSGGQQQMLAIAQALMTEPKVLLLDEPSAGLAPQLVRGVMNKVVEISRSGIAVLLVEQTVHEALRVTDRVYVLRLGQCIEQPDFRSVEQASLLERLYMG